MKTENTVNIRNVYPELAGGRYPIKREVDRPLVVTADIYGPPGMRVNLLSKKKYPTEAKKWSSRPMKTIGSPSFRGEILFPDEGIYFYSLEVRRPGKKAVRYQHDLEVYVEPARARYAAWYEMFPRSQGTVKGKHGTFPDAEKRLPDIKRMGFNVIYLPPIHPIGKTNRKGKNNSLRAKKGDPGVPWSVGTEFGGHTAVHPKLGTLKDFRHFIGRAEKAGIDIAIDYTSNCSPDHPWIKEHPEWFFYNPDGTIKYAENPPKKYEDVCPLNFEPADREAMWEEIKKIFIFWIENGVKTFRIDNPHTKPTAFWRWLIRSIKEVYPEIVFLAEAFTDYDKLEELALSGFSQSYCYFTWRNGKDELIEYFIKLTGTYLKEFLRVNLFVNTPDILSEILQKGGKPAFKMRIALAATLSSAYGMYSGYELIENDPLVPGKESYMNSEKYQIKVRNWDKRGNIKEYIRRLNRIREQNPSLQYYDNLQFFSSTDSAILFYGKISPDGENRILVAINLDPYNSHTGRITVPVERFGISSDESYKVTELITGKRMTWRGREQYITLDPKVEPAAILKI